MVNGSSLQLLSTMITPAILILASSSLIQATSSRLSRLLERVRHLAALGAENPASPASASHAAQLELYIRRARLLQRAMTRLYLALTMFVTTSFLIGVTGFFFEQHAAIPLAAAFAGIVLMMSAGIKLVLESHLAVAAVDAETGFVREVFKKN